MWSKYVIVSDLDELKNQLANETSPFKLIAGGTDLILELERSKQTEALTLIDISRIPELKKIWLDSDDQLHIGAAVTHNSILTSQLTRQFAFPLVQACWTIGSPQIRNRGTIGGNLVTASPANDTITPLMALNAKLLLVSKAGHRTVELNDFYKGVRKTIIKNNEYLQEIIVPCQKQDEKGIFIKSALRKAQAISVVNACVILKLNGGSILNAKITLGSVAPTIIHAQLAENFLIGKDLTTDVIKQCGGLAKKDASPISDIRGSDSYRSYVVEVIVKKALESIKNNNADPQVPFQPVTLSANVPEVQSKVDKWDGSKIVTTLNGEVKVFLSGFDKTLLHLIREEGQLTGTKEGCAEGECGACTIILNGSAVMSCLIPAPCAHGAIIETIEGLAVNGSLHPLQEAFVSKGAVQCGFCTPGFIMSGAKLLEEKSSPTRDEILSGISGNLCRCTGYYKIIEAIESASEIKDLL